MKNTLKNTVITATILIAPLFALADSKGTSTGAPHNLAPFSVEGITELPQATHNPMPAVRSSLVGLKLKVKFTVNEQGRAKNIHVITPPATQSDVHIQSFASQMEQKIKNWKFEPALDKDDNPIAVKLNMPVHVVKKNSKTSLVASLSLDKDTKDRS